MPAANTDKVRKKKSFFQTTLNGSIDDNDTSLELNAATGLPTDTAITLIIDRVDSNGVATPSAREIVTGTLSGTTLSNLLRGEESITAKAHANGAVVEMVWDAETWNDFCDAFLVGHGQDGQHKIADVQTIDYAADAGGDDTYEVTLDPVPSAYFNGMRVLFKPTTANTGAATLNVNSLGAKTIKKLHDQDLETGDIEALQMVLVAYNSSADVFELLSPTAVKPATLTGTEVLSAKTLTKPIINASVQGVESYAPSASGTATLDLDLANIHKITMPAGNITIALSNEDTGQIFFVEITQDSGGSRTVTWFSTIRWAGGSAPTLTTTGNKRDVFAFRVTGSGTYDGYVVGFNI